MSSFFKNFGGLLLAIIAASAMIISALIWKNTEYENMWLYILCVYLVLQGFWDMYVKRQGRGS